MILNLYRGQSIILDVASTERNKKWPLPTGEEKPGDKIIPILCEIYNSKK